MDQIHMWFVFYGNRNKELAKGPEAESECNMADKNNETVRLPSEQIGGTADEAQNIDATDDFDPFSDVVECLEENIDIALSAPPENQWYHGRLDRNTAEDRLRDAGMSGSYLIRESDRKPGSYVLSFLGLTGINHFRITAMCGDYYIGGREFDTLSDLIGYYTSWSDLLKGERLQHPVAPPEPVYDKRKVIAILPYTQIPDTDELSFDKGEIFVVHNDLGDGWLWVTSQSRGLGGIINQELVQELNDNVDLIEVNDWFHADITKQEAAERLAKAGPGSWLVRPSDSTTGDYSLFFYCNKQIQRFKIQKYGRQYLMGGRQFESIASIVERYKKEQIVEGYTLGEPVLKYRVPMLNEDDNRNGKDIYAFMRQSSGSNFFLNRKDHIVIKGHLNKKSQRTKKWKYMYFVLNGTEQQLYYFENQKRSKPKGLIELTYSSLYPVHDSLFGRPNCFQIITRALNQVSVYYICADNTDQAQEWIQAIKPYCMDQQQVKKIPKSVFTPLTELRSLQLKIYDARKLSMKHVPHAYCIVSLNEVKVARTQVKDAPDPCWDEEFMLDDIPPDIESFSISVYNKSKRSKDTEVVCMKVLLNELEAGQWSDKWYMLSPVNITNKLEGGSLRVSIRYLHEIIMPLKEYTSLKELMLAKDLETVLALVTVCATNNNRAPLATALLQIFRHERQEAHLLKTINDLEIDQEESSATLFRSTTMASTLMDQFMKMTAMRFLQQAVQGVINKIMEGKVSCEINPSMLDNPSDQEVNAKQLISILNEAVNSIFSSVSSCPMVLRYVCHCLQKKVGRKWPNESLVRTRVVSGFIFLRLLCLAVLNPKQFNLITEAPSQMAARTLKLVANCLIKLANLAEAKEPYMEVINPFIQENKPRMIEFINELSNVHQVPQATEVPAVDIARSLANIHQICVTNLEDLQKISQEKPFIKKVVAVTDMLTKHKKHYLNQ